jgi:predicted ATP-grasp superfamily ATP-dependent carboligase
MTWAETVPLDRRLAASIGNALRAIGWNGLYQVDFFEQPGDFVLIDLNPRFYTSLAMAMGAGVNLPGIWVDLLCGRAPRVPATYQSGVRYRHDEDDVRALFRMLIHGPRGAALRGFVPRRDTVHPVFSLRDPWPLLTSLSKLVRQVRRRQGAAHGPTALSLRPREGISES